MSAKKKYESLIGSWPILLLAGFASALLPSVAVVGYRWTVEFALAGFLLFSLSFAVLTNRQIFSRLTKKEFIWIILPLVLFILWSGLSMLWAVSWRGALHHTLLWSCYLVFYFLIRTAFANSEILGSSLTILAAMVFAISTACVIEYIGMPKPLTVDFTSRYYLYAEMFAALMPIFVALSFDKQESKWPIAATMVVAIAWAMILATTSRTMFAAGLAGLSVFLLLRLIRNQGFSNPWRWLAYGGLLFAITLVFQIPLTADKNISLSERFSGNEEYSVLSAKSRILLWGMAIEGFREHPVAGMGGDNYFYNYKTLRENYSARNLDSPVIAINEDLIPERAHNEYLQILSELGIVGGFLFAWLLIGIAWMFYQAWLNGASVISVGALSGLVAFLVASAASSYSFRFATNGLCFFFLLALAAGEFFKRESGETVNVVLEPYRFRWKPVFAIFGITISIFTVSFSAVRGLSIRHLANAQNTNDHEFARNELKEAIALDSTEPMFRFYYGQELYLLGKVDESIPQFHLAIENGLSSSTAYFNLVGAQMKVGKNNEANKTFDEALRVFPRSVFLRTAYSSFLKKNGNADEADAEFQKAYKISPKQARSWELAHDQGLERLTQIARVDENFAPTVDLKPDQAPLALVNFQRLNTPDQGN